MENALSEGLSVAGNMRLINDFTGAVNIILKFLDLSPNIDDDQAMESDGKNEYIQVLLYVSKGRVTSAANSIVWCCTCPSS
jgi:hypothetical protein